MQLHRRPFLCHLRLLQPWIIRQRLLLHQRVLRRLRLRHQILRRSFPLRLLREQILVLDIPRILQKPALHQTQKPQLRRPHIHRQRSPHRHLPLLLCRARGLPRMPHLHHRRRPDSRCRLRRTQCCWKQHPHEQRHPQSHRAARSPPSCCGRPRWKRLPARARRRNEFGFAHKNNLSLPHLRGSAVKASRCHLER